MNVLITGVAGLLGSRLANWIQKNTEHTVAVSYTHLTLPTTPYV